LTADHTSCAPTGTVAAPIPGATVAAAIPAAPAHRGQDFTRGSIPRHLIVFTWPMFIGQLLQTMYTVVNAIWVGQFLGPDALAATSVGFPIIFALIALVLGLTMATTVLVSQHFGARQPEMVTRAVNSSLLLQVVLGAVVTIVGIAARRPLLALVNTPPEIMGQASAYLGIILSGMIPMFLFNAVSSVLRGLGDSRTPLRLLVYSTVLNAVLDPLLIVGLGPIPRLGVAGAALASVISIVLSAVMSLRYLPAASRAALFRREFFTPDWRIIRAIFRIGLPAGLQQVVTSLAFVAVSALVNGFGTEAAAGLGLAQRLEQLGIMPAMAVGMAVSALVGQNLGAGNVKRAREVAKWAILLSVGVTLLYVTLSQTCPALLMRVFTREAGVAGVGISYLRTVSRVYPFTAVFFVLSGVLRGAGDTTPSLVFSVLCLWVLRVPLAAYLSAQPELGVRGVWLAIAASPPLNVLLHSLYYRYGPWLKKAVVRRARAGSPA
jgi:putative MATE family efflux protein